MGHDIAAVQAIDKTQGSGDAGLLDGASLRKGWSSGEWTETATTWDEEAMFKSDNPADKRAAALWNNPLICVSTVLLSADPNKSSIDYWRKFVLRHGIRAPISTAEKLGHTDRCMALKSHQKLSGASDSISNFTDTNHKVGNPFISTSTDAKEMGARAAFLEPLVADSQGLRTHKILLTLIDPRTRLRFGDPVINFYDEAVRSKLDTTQIDRSEWLCLWGVTPLEVVWTWDWDELKSDSEWYENTVEPALRKFQKNRERPKNKASNDQGREDDSLAHSFHRLSAKIHEVFERH
jgi:hypothetical protein